MSLTRLGKKRLLGLRLVLERNITGSLSANRGPHFISVIREPNEAFIKCFSGLIVVSFSVKVPICEYLANKVYL